MAAGDYVKRTNTTSTDTVPTAGSQLTLTWNNAVANVGSGITYSAGTFTLGETGHFLVICSDQDGTTSTTNNERINTKMILELGGTELVEGYSTGYIRKSSGNQEEIHSCMAIINVTSTAGTADDLIVKKERIDDSTTGSPARIADRSGITIIKLDDTLDVGLYQSSSVVTTSTTDNAATTINLGTTVEEDATFTRTGNAVDIATTDPVLAIYSLKSEDATPVGRAEYQGRLTLAGSVVNGSYSQCYIRVTDNCDWGGMCGFALLFPTSGDDATLEVVSRENGGEEFEGTLQLIKLPAALKKCLVEATTGDANTAATNFAWDTNPQIDTDTFTHTATNANVDVDVAGDYLVFSSLADDTNAGGGAIQRATPAIQFRVNTTDDESGGNACYHRGNGTADHFAMSTGALLTGLSINDSIYTRCDRIGTVTSTLTNSNGAMVAIQLTSMVAGGDVTMEADTGSYTLTGTAATLEKATPKGAVHATVLGATLMPFQEYPDVGVTNYTIVADGGSYSLTGTDVNLEKHSVINAESGSYTLTGASVGLIITLSAGSGSYAVTGSDANLEKHSVISAESGSYAITGADVSFEYHKVISAEPGSYAVTGADVSLEYHVAIDAETGAYTITGTDANLEVHRVLNAESGGYAVTGSDAGLSKGLLLNAESGTYALTGTNANLEKHYEIQVEAGAYSVTGSDANLEYARIMAADSGSYSVTGGDVNFLVGKQIQAESGAYLITGDDTNLEKGSLITAESGSYLLTGADVTFTITGADVTLDAEGGSYLVAGTDADLTYTPTAAVKGGSGFFGGRIDNIDTKKRDKEEKKKRIDRELLREMITEQISPSAPKVVIETIEDEVVEDIHEIETEESPRNQVLLTVNQELVYYNLIQQQLTNHRRLLEQHALKISHDAQLVKEQQIKAERERISKDDDEAVFLLLDL